MIVCILSLGSYWREPKNGRPVVWNSTGVVDHRGLRPRAKILGQISMRSCCYNQAIAASGFRRSLWYAQPISEHLGIRKLSLDRRAARGSSAEWCVVAVNEQLVGTLDDSSWDPETTIVLSFSQWKSRQEALLLVRDHAWLRGSAGSAILTPNAAHGDWTVTKW